MSKSIADTHNFVSRLTEDAVFSQAQAERLKDVLTEELSVATKEDLERGLQRVTIQLLLAMFAQAALVIAGVQYFTSL